MLLYWRVFSPARTLRAVILLLMSLVLCMESRMVSADGFWYGGGNTSWLFDGGLTSGSAVSGSTGIPYTTAPGIQWTHTFQNGLNQATAQEGLGRSFTADSLRLAIAPGTGVSQSAPAGGNTPTVFDINFSINAESHGRNGESLQDIVGEYNLPLTAVVPEGSWVSASFTVTFLGIIGTYTEPNYAIVFEKTLSSQWTKNTSGTEQHTLADSINLPDLMGEYGAQWPGYGVSIFGKLSFTAKNDGGPVAIDLPSGFSLQSRGTINHGGPEWVGPAGGNWSEPGNWMPQTIPDAPNAIATLGPNTPGGMIDLKSTTRTVGTLGFAAGYAPYTIVATGDTPGTLCLQTTTGNALVRFAANNQQDNEIAAPVKLLSDTTFGMGEHTLTLSNTVDFGGHSITVESGSLVVLEEIANAGMVTVKAGTLTAASITTDTLTIGTPSAATFSGSTSAPVGVPEPSALALFGMGTLGLFIFGCRPWKRS